MNAPSASHNVLLKTIECKVVGVFLWVVNVVCVLQEETDVQLEAEKLDRERNLHIREMKRLQHEDDSR